jgi:mono/diheme cytochrome c family protein
MRRAAVLLALAVMSCSQVPETQSPSLTADELVTAGEPIYIQYCSACHQPDGNGLPNLQPPLCDNAVVMGDPRLLIHVVLEGPAAVLPANRPKYQNAMPGFAILTDPQMAELLTYIRVKFGNNAAPIQPSDVAAIRATVPQ